MTKTHVHIPSGNHDYKFVVERRDKITQKKYVNKYGKPWPQSTSQIWYVVVEKERRFELAPWFDNLMTATEMAEKATRGDQFCNAIPCVAYETLIPRPDGSWFRPQEYSGRKE